MHISRVLTSLLMCCFSFFISVLAYAADKKTMKSAESPTKQLTEFAASSGVRTCLKRMGEVNDYVVKNNQAGAYIFVSPQDPNRKITSTSLEIYSADNTALYYASTSVVPTSVNDCSIVFDTVSYHAQSCDKISKSKGYANYKLAGMLAKKVKVISIDEKQPNARIFLMPAGSGCIVINKEVI